VWVNKEEIASLAAELGENDIEQFEHKYVRKVGIRKSLKEFPNGDCVFFDSTARNCNVYGARPRQCRTWPFWNSNLKTAMDWQQTCEVCPGSGKGRLYLVDEIEAQRRVIRV
jgi:Fe-S-cluster containining protein